MTQETAPFFAIEEAMNKLREFKNGSDQEFWDEAGWTGSNTMYKFKAAGGAPLKALRSLQGVILINTPTTPFPSSSTIEVHPMFSIEELVDLMLVLRGYSVSDSARRALLKKIVHELSIEEE